LDAISLGGTGDNRNHDGVDRRSFLNLWPLNANERAMLLGFFSQLKKWQQTINEFAHVSVSTAHI
jgi:hypothetical protein